MDGQNKLFNLFVAAFAGVLVVAVFVFVVSLGINIAITPLAVALKDVGRLNARVSALETDMKTLKQGSGARQQPPAEDLSKVYDLPIGNSYVFGKADARITVVEFTDLQCPFCSRFHPVLMDAYKAFPDDVKIVIKNYPLEFHPQARPAAKATLAAGLQGKYFEMVDAVMKAGKELSDDKYKELAGNLGLNVEKFVKDLKDKDAEFEKQLAEDMALVKKADVRGTPAYFLNGKKTMARTVEAWKAEIQGLLKK